MPLSLTSDAGTRRHGDAATGSAYRRVAVSPRLRVTSSVAPADRPVGRVLAVDPGALQLLVGVRLQGAAGVAGVPADDVVRLAALLAAGLPARRPTRVGLL